MGHGIAQVFAASGVPVVLNDVSAEALERGISGVRQNLAFLAERGTFAAEKTEEVVGRIEATTDRVRALDGADLVIECVFEDLALKRNLFAEMDALCPPETVLATNTSVISITEIAAAAEGKERIVGTHFWNPPYLVPLVEVVKGDQSSDAAVEWVHSVLKDVGKHPVIVQKDVPGFVANRLQHALWREAISIVERGIADPATVDECIRFGFGLRLPALGPLENADLVGLDLTLSIHDYILRHLEDSHEASPLLREKVDAGELGFKTGRGFQEWSEEEQAAVRRRMMDHLVRATRNLNKGRDET
ncbi:MAG: 3-hydroxyacyl-CoA dehydrogenase NAD-binding domain-containing protein [Thermoleophilia bacterium]